MHMKSVLMTPEVNGVFSWETDIEAKRHGHLSLLVILSLLVMRRANHYVPGATAP
jgi:hypothetical protein